MSETSVSEAYSQNPDNHLATAKFILNTVLYYNPDNKKCGDLSRSTFEVTCFIDIICDAGTEDRRKNNVSQAHDHGSQHKADQDGFGVTIRDMPAAFLLLLKNPAFVCQCLIGAGEGLMVSGLSTFLPKFIANQFNQTNSWAAMLTGTSPQQKLFDACQENNDPAVLSI